MHSLCVFQFTVSFIWIKKNLILPALLKIYLENVLYDWNKKHKSMGLPEGNETVHHHLGADDQDIVGQDI
jgi:hypothetical protein